MKTPLLICATWSILLVACAHTSKQQNNSPAPTDSLHEYSVSHLQTDTLNPEQIQLHAELVYDSTSYLVIENRSTLPVRTDCNYEFAHYIHYKWKRTDVNHTDTSSFTIPAGGKDTIWIDFKKQIGYEPIGKCTSNTPHKRNKKRYPYRSPTIRVTFFKGHGCAYGTLPVPRTSYPDDRSYNTDRWKYLHAA